MQDEQTATEWSEQQACLQTVHITIVLIRPAFPNLFVGHNVQGTRLFNFCDGPACRGRTVLGWGVVFISMSSAKSRKYCLVNIVRDVFRDRDAAGRDAAPIFNGTARTHRNISAFNNSDKGYGKAYIFLS